MEPERIRNQPIESKAAKVTRSRVMVVQTPDGRRLAMNRAERRRRGIR